MSFLRHEKQTSGIAFRLLIKEPLMVILPTGHRLAARKAIPPHELAREKKFIHPAKTAPVLRSVINDYVEKVGIALKSTYEAENLSALMSLVESSGGVGLAPLYVKNMLIPSVVARPLQGESPILFAPFCAHCDSREGGFVELHIKRFPQQFICDARFRIGEFFGNLLNFGDHPWIQFVGLANSIDWWSAGARSAPAMS